MNYVIIIINMDRILFGNLRIRDGKDEPYFPEKEN